MNEYHQEQRNTQISEPGQPNESTPNPGPVEFADDSSNEDHPPPAEANPAEALAEFPAGSPEDADSATDQGPAEHSSADGSQDDSASTDESDPHPAEFPLTKNNDQDLRPIVAETAPEDSPEPNTDTPANQTADGGELPNPRDSTGQEWNEEQPTPRPEKFASDADPTESDTHPVELSTHKFEDKDQSDASRARETEQIDNQDRAETTKTPAWAGREWNEVVENLPQPQKNALHEYSMEGSGDGKYVTYREINSSLREIPGHPMTPEIQERVDLMDEALATHPTPCDLTVTRGINVGHWNFKPEDAVGQNIDERSFMSTALGDPPDAFNNMDAVLHLDVPKGTPAIWMEKVSVFGGSERELLLARGLTWTPSRVEWRENQWHIFGKVTQNDLPK